MIYAVQEKASGRLLACSQINGYGLPYYGILLWESAPEEAEIAEALARAAVDSAPESWLPVELIEHQAKMANVKLRNDPGRQVFLQGDALVASRTES